MKKSTEERLEHEGKTAAVEAAFKKFDQFVLNNDARSVSCSEHRSDSVPYYGDFRDIDECYLELLKTMKKEIDQEIKYIRND